MYLVWCDRNVELLFRKYEDRDIVSYNNDRNSPLRTK